MKRMFKWGWIVLIVGLLTLTVGYLNHGNQNINFAAGRPQVQREGSWQLSRKVFDRVNLDVGTADVTIKRGRRFVVSYQGRQAERPQVSVKDRVLTIKQTGSHRYSFFQMHVNQNQVTITLPRNAQIRGGEIDMATGNLTVTDVDLADTTISNDSGDVDLNGLTLENGRAKLASGNFTAQRVQVNGHYRVDNDAGDNTAREITADGYRLQTSDGDNTVNGQEHDDQLTVTHNLGAANVLELVSDTGDNEYHD